MNILLAEDDPHDQMLFVMAAGDCKSEVDIAVEFANDGAALLHELRLRSLTGSQADLVVLDMRMPILDGHQVLDALAADPLLADVEVGVFSSSYRQQDIDHSLEKGAKWHEVKPSKYEELVGFVARIAASFAAKTAD